MHSWFQIILMHHTEQVTDTIRGAISSAWHWGIKHDVAEIHGELIVHEFQLNGNPWFAVTDESVEARRLVLEIMTRMANIGYQLHANVNIKVKSTFYSKHAFLKSVKNLFFEQSQFHFQFHF